MKNRIRPVLLVAALVLLSACREEAVQSTVPQDMTPETLGHYAR
ncbi:hypothetical protein AB3G45_01885 [Shinella sp. S4-D37]